MNKLVGLMYVFCRTVQRDTWFVGFDVRQALPGFSAVLLLLMLNVIVGECDYF